jgi:hypothetical protein
LRFQAIDGKEKKSGGNELANWGTRNRGRIRIFAGMNEWRMDNQEWMTDMVGGMSEE